MQAVFWDWLKPALLLLGDDRLRNAAIIIGVFFALLSIHTARVLARKKQSADMLFASKRDPGMQEGYLVIRQCHDGAENMRLMATTHRESEKAIKIRYLLNHFESLSVGIRAKIYDEQMIKESWCSVITTSYKKSLPLIEAMREADNNPTVFQSLEWLALRWKKNPLQPYPATWQGKFWHFIRSRW